MPSLQDQLLKAGIVDQKKAEKLVKEKRKEEKRQPKGHARIDESREQAKRAALEKTERDRQLNRQQQALAEERAIQAQIIQLIQLNRIGRIGSEVAYQFVDGRKIKKIHVTPQLQNDLVRGRVGIARFGEGYELVPAATARKVMQRDQRAIVLLNDKEPLGIDEEDPYAQYQIPDDLMW
jgi:uncharacterized protein YaiL (DUF2058 family)